MLGRFSIIWAQIDVSLTTSICKLVEVDMYGGQILMEGMTTGPRLNIFRGQYKSKIKDPVYLDRSKKFCEKMNSLIEHRNHLSHGTWGFHCDNQSKVKTPACYYAKTKTHISASTLPEITKKSG